MGCMNELEISQVKHKGGETLSRFKMRSIEVDGILSDRFDSNEKRFHVAPNWMFDTRDEDIEHEAFSEDSEGYLDDTYHDVSWSGEQEVVMKSDGVFNEDAWLHGGYIEFV